ncbi:response regulator [Siculibacillus lacustris]|uniref:Response regulator n=1 Tax=Siculibacillus lacustris TaxID=1549641 RepID=A0A4Q9VVS8_9HYPH|nr:response regulator [Siculibacillus lacustris]TBW40377.1 response regulator [Siculibacillus lacustris]
MPRIDDVAPWTALLVEDEALIAASTEALLFELGATEVRWATTVEEAERQIETEAPTIAVVDWFVGRRTAEPLVNRLADQGVGILLLTGASPEDIVRPADAEILVLGKPARDAAVAEAIRRLLRRGPEDFAVTDRRWRAE